MKYLMPFFLLLGASLWADDSSVLESRKVISLSPLFQSWSIEANGNTSDLAEISNMLFVQVPINPRFNLTLQGSQAYLKTDGISSSGGAIPENFFGMSDIQLGANAYIPAINGVFGLKMNIPGGKKGFSQTEYLGLIDLSNSVFRFQVPSFGQGFNISPSFIIAREAGENVALGLGISYTLRGAFDPFETADDGTLNPGDEFLITGGFDVRIDPASKFAADVTFGVYSKDSFEIGDEAAEDVFKAGSRLRINTAYQRTFGFHLLRIDAIFRNEAKNESLTAQNPADTETLPGNLHTQLYYRQQFNRTVRAALQLEGRFYQDNETTFSGGNLFGFGLTPELVVNPQVSLALRLKYLTGSFRENASVSGFESGLGLNIRI